MTAILVDALYVYVNLSSSTSPLILIRVTRLFFPLSKIIITNTLLSVCFVDTYYYKVTPFSFPLSP